MHVNFHSTPKTLMWERKTTKIIKSSYTLKKSVFCTFLTYITVWKIPWPTVLFPLPTSIIISANHMTISKLNCFITVNNYIYVKCCCMHVTLKNTIMKMVHVQGRFYWFRFRIFLYIYNFFFFQIWFWRESSVDNEWSPWQVICS